MIGSPSAKAFYIAAGYILCLAVIGVLLLRDKEKSARVDALQRRLKIERQLHEQEWQAQQRALELETKRGSGAERQTRMKSK